MSHEVEPALRAGPRGAGFPDNARLFLPATAFAPSQRAWVPTGVPVPVSPAVPASSHRDRDDR